jgi:HPt (histidine-containing phosphotransfer) domain-containing protein
VRDEEQEKQSPVSDGTPEQPNRQSVPEEHPDQAGHSGGGTGPARRALGAGLAGLDMEKGIECFGGDEESYFEVLRSYAVNTPSLLEKVKTVSPESLAEYAITVHGIKGSSLGIVANEVGNQAEALENAAKSNNYDFISANHPVFLESAWKLIADVQSLLDALYEQKPKQKKDKPDGETLKKLLAACKNYDMDAVDAAIAEVAAYEYEADDGLADWLKENVEQTNFRKIIEKLSVLAG